MMHVWVVEVRAADWLAWRVKRCYPSRTEARAQAPYWPISRVRKYVPEKP